MNEALKQFLQEENKSIGSGVVLFNDFEGKLTKSVYVKNYKYDYIKYLSKSTEDENDEENKNEFLFVRREIEIWLRVVLMLDMLNNRKPNASAVIYLPGQNLEVSVGTFIANSVPKNVKPFSYDTYLWESYYNTVASLCMDLPYFDESKKEAIKTPIGIMDSFVLDAILGVVPNPITETYRILINLNEQIHDLLSKQGVPRDVVLTDELLDRYKIKDVLGVHVFDISYPVIAEFLNIPRGSSERREHMQFNDYLEEKTKEYSKVVQDFTEVLALYEGESDEQVNDACVTAYSKALDAVRMWVRLVGQLNLLEAQYMESTTLLHMPEDDITVNISTRVSILSSVNSNGGRKLYTDIEGYNPGREEVIVTPIGEMGSDMLNKILEIKDNPVMLLYKHFGDLLHCIHNILSMPLHDELSGDVILTAELLAEHGINDVLHVYKMDKSLYWVNKFFKS